MFNLGNFKNLQFPKYKKKNQFGNFQKCPIRKIPQIFKLENEKNLEFKKFEKFSILKNTKICNVANSKKLQFLRFKKFPKFCDFKKLQIFKIV